MIKGKSKKQNKRLKIDSLFFLALLLSTQVTCFIGCKLGEITTHNTEKNELQCEKCPKGCGICRKNNQNFYCLSCEEGHFYSDGSCLPCKEECSSCTGPKITDCTELKEGYVFSFKEKTIKKCPNNCLRCTEEQECLECKHGSMSIQTGKKYGKREIVECSPCQEANCRVCSKHKLIFKLGYEVCDQCNEGFGHKMMRRDCVNCLDNCEECDKSHDMCSKCKIGFYLTDNGRKCQKFEIENCEEYDSKTGKCVKCEMYYSLDEENKRCLSCLEVTNGCSTCARDYPGDTSIKNTAVNPKYKGKFYCTGCVEGYNRNFDTGGCEKSEDNCMEKENGVKGSCVQCVPGFYFKKEENKCVEIPKISKIEGCISYDPFNFDSCNVCLDSYFLGGDRKCHKCHPSCSLCNAEGPRNCLYCPINKLIWRIEEHNSRPKFWEEMKFLCLNNCSDLDSDKFKYEKSETGRNCLQNERKEKPSDEDYSFFRFEDKGRRSIIKEIKIFSRKYREYVRQDKLKNMKLQKEKKTDFDPSCSFVGKLKEKLAEDRETIYECDCKEGEYGPLCEISEGLYTASNRFLNKSLKDVAQYHPYMKMTAVNLLDGVMLNPQNLNFIISEYLEKIDSFQLGRTQNIGHFLKGYDVILMTLYETLQEDLRRNGASKDISSIEEREKIYQIFKKVMDYLDKFSIRNLPKNQGYFENVISPTKAFHVSMFDHTFKPDLFNPQKPPLELNSPYIGPGKEKGEKIEILLDYKEYSNNKDLVVTAFSYSSELHKKPSRGYFATNLVHIFISKVEKESKNSTLVNPKQGDLFIKFPLKISPVEKNLKSVLKCYMIQEKGESTSLYYEHKITDLKINEADIVEVWCGFEKVNLESSYFAVAYEGSGENSWSDKRIQKAVEGGDEYVIEDYEPPKEVLWIGILNVLWVMVFAGVLVG